MMSRHLSLGWMKVIACYNSRCIFLFLVYMCSIVISYKNIPLDQVIEGLDRAVKTMKKGEVALIVIQPEYAFGQSGSTHMQELAVIPGNSAVHYEVEMVSFVKVGDIMESVLFNCLGVRGLCVWASDYNDVLSL